MTTTVPGPAPTSPTTSSPGGSAVVPPAGKKKSDNFLAKFNRVVVMIISWVLLGTLFYATSYAILSRLEFIPANVAFKLSEYVALIGCIIFAYRKFSIYHIDVPSMKAWVTLNEYVLKKEYKLRVYTQGFHFIYPWEIIQPNLEVDLINDQIKLTSEGEDGNHPTYLSQEKVKLTGKWFALIRPDEDNLDAYIAIKEEAIEEYFANRINQCISDECGKKTVDEIRSNKKAISEEVAKVFLLDKRSPEENECGVIISNPVLSDIDLDPKALDALAVLARTVEDEARATAMVKASTPDGGQPGLTHKEALEHIRISKGQSDEVFVRGFENLRGSVMLPTGAIPPDAFGGGRKHKNKGGTDK